MTMRVALALSIFAIGCSNPSIRRVNDKFFSEHKPKKVVVARFEGKPDFVEESTDYFIAQLAAMLKVEIVRGGPSKSESPDISGAGNIGPIEAALSEAKLKSADLLIVGKVSSHRTAGAMNGFSTIRIYDVATGVEVANFHRPSGLAVAFSEHQCVMKAVFRTAADTLALFK